MDAQEIIKRDETLKGQRGNWEKQWQELREMVRPMSASFVGKLIRGEEVGQNAFDGTPRLANTLLAAGLASFLTPPTERWFNLTLKNRELLEDDEVLLWLEMVSDQMFTMYALPDVNFNPQLHENYLDIGAYGTSVIFQEWNFKRDMIKFRTFPLANCRMLESEDNRVDTLFRTVTYTTRQARQRWSETLPKKITDEKNPDKEWAFIHAVFPREELSKKKRGNRGYPFASIWINVEEKAVLSEGGFTRFPYHVARWSKVTGETYGRSPAMDCLPDIRLLNELERTGLKAMQKLVDPTLIVDHDGFLLPIRTTPSAMIFRENPESRIEPLKTDGDVRLNEEKLRQKREHVLSCFFVDRLQLQKNNVEMTAYEASERREEQLRLMAPQLGRLQTELLGPMLRRTFELMKDKGVFPPSPPVLKDQTLEIEYVSPAAKAQLSSKAHAITRYLQDMIPFAQVAPEVMDTVNPDGLAKEMAILRDVSRKTLRSEKEVKAIRAQRQQAMQAQQAIQMGSEMAGAVKDLSVAGKNAPPGALV